MKQEHFFFICIIGTITYDMKIYKCRDVASNLAQELKESVDGMVINIFIFKMVIENHTKLPYSKYCKHL